MKILLSALHHASFRSFESVVVELAARGHHVHLAADEPETMGGQQLAERLAAAHPSVSWDFVPSLEREPWFDTARRLRAGLDYARVLAPQYAASPKLRVRAEARAPRLVRWSTAVPAIGPRATRAALTRLERLMPRSALMEDYLRRQAPDVLVLASLTYSRSQQFDQLKAARALGIPVAAAVMSWDHLSSKALLHIAPDMVLVWNDVQRREAIAMHALPPGRIVVTGAQCFDQWFARAPARSREAFCGAVGLRADRPFVLWVNSVFNPPIDPPEPALVLRWLEALRGSHPALSQLGVLIRPHPERAGDWRGVNIERFENVAVHGGNPIDAGAKDDYFDALFHSAAVVGLATSAFVEAAIVGRPVLSLTLPEYRMHQGEMVHFQYLRTVGGGLLHTAPDIETHLAQLAGALAAGGGRDQRNQRFLAEFVRPGGLDVPATPVFVDAIERLAHEGTRPDASLEQHRWLRPVVGAAAARGQRGVGRWLLLDRRGDDLEDDRAHKRQAASARVEAKLGYRQEKVRRTREQRRQAFAGGRKRLKSLLRRTRYLAAVAVYRVLTAAGLGQGGVPGAGKR